MTMSRGRDKIWYLQKIDILSGLLPEEMKFIDQRSRMCTYKKGSVIDFADGDTEKIIFLKKGKVKLYRTDPSGKELVTAVLRDREVFGGLSPFDGADNEFAEALEDSLACLIDKKVFFSFIKDKPYVVLRLNKLLSLKVYELQMLLEDLTFKTVRERLVSLLLKLNEKFGSRHGGAEMIDISLTHGDLAAMIGSTRESATVALNKLKSLGLIDSRKKRIIINDVQTLAEYKDPTA